MKYVVVNISIKKSYVAPFAGAWIEIRPIQSRKALLLVAPFAGAWIEIPR